MREEAAALGISAVGVTSYDARYQFAEYSDGSGTDPAGDRVIVCILEQNYGATQRIPAERSEQAALSTYAQLQDRLVELTRWLHARGFTARPETYLGESMFIHYAVAAGLGQLGLNGQLLTPHAGSRCRINVIHTERAASARRARRLRPRGRLRPLPGVRAALPRGRDPGAAARAPRRRQGEAQHQALPADRHPGGGVLGVHEGLPRAGLRAAGRARGVRRDRAEILGTHTDALEGYDWPLDGRHYPPGETPRVPDEVVRPEGFAFDPDRTTPPEGSYPVLG